MLWNNTYENIYLGAGSDLKLKRAGRNEILKLLETEGVIQACALGDGRYLEKIAECPKRGNNIESPQGKKKLVESQIITLTKKLKPTDKSIGDISNLKENKEVLTKTLNNIDNQLGEVSTKTEKANLLDKELRLKIQNHMVLKQFFMIVKKIIERKLGKI